MCVTLSLSLSVHDEYTHRHKCTYIMGARWSRISYFAHFWIVKLPLNCLLGVKTLNLLWGLYFKTISVNFSKKISLFFINVLDFMVNFFPQIPPIFENFKFAFQKSRTMSKTVEKPRTSRFRGGGGNCPLAASLWNTIRPSNRFIFTWEILWLCFSHEIKFSTATTKSQETCAKIIKSS